MEEKVTSLVDELDESVQDLGSTDESKVEMIESFATDAEETEMEVEAISPEVKEEVVVNSETETSNKQKDCPEHDQAANKMWTLAVVGSVLILLASAGGVIFILLQGA